MDILKRQFPIKSLIFLKSNCHAKMAPDNRCDYRCADRRRAGSGPQGRREAQGGLGRGRDESRGPRPAELRTSSALAAAARLGFIGAPPLPEMKHAAQSVRRRI